MKTTRWTAVIVLGLMFAVGACARNAKPSTGEVSPTAGSVAVIVTNNNLADVDVYAIADGGMRLRLGTVTAVSSATLTARPSMFATGTLRLVASPIGGRGLARTDPLLVAGGQTVNFTILPNLAASFGTVQ